MRYVLHKDKARLTKDELWYLERYTSMPSELKEAYELKELYKKWQVEILNRYVFSYSNGFLEAYFKAKILLSSVYIARGNHLG